MLKERLQILMGSEQRKRLETEAKRRNMSVAALIREAVDQHLGTISREERARAVEGIRAMRGRFLPPDELERLLEEERTRAAAP